MNCVKCGKKATKAYSPDLDIKGVGTCEECKKDVGIAYLMLIQGTPKMAEDFTKKWSQPIKIK